MHDDPNSTARDAGNRTESILVFLIIVMTAALAIAALVFILKLLHR